MSATDEKSRIGTGGASAPVVVPRAKGGRTSPEAGRNRPSAGYRAALARLEAMRSGTSLTDEGAEWPAGEPEVIGKP